jgi:hypothetical protein
MNKLDAWAWSPLNLIEPSQKQQRRASRPTEEAS